MLRIGRVAKVHWEDHSVDLSMVDDGSHLAGVQVLSPTASTNTGFNDLPKPATPGSGDVWDRRERTPRDLLAVVGQACGLPVVLGFLYPQINQLLFKRDEFRVDRHASDVYSTIDKDGNTELYHPSGTYLRIGTSPDHEDLTGQDFDEKWKIERNTDKAVHVKLRVSNAGSPRATIQIDPSGNLSAWFAGNATVDIDGNANINIDGNLTSRVHGTADITHDGQTTVTTPTLTINASSQVVVNSPAVQVNSGTVTVSGGDVIADGISLKHHVHSGVQGGLGNTGQPVA